MQYGIIKTYNFYITHLTAADYKKNDYSIIQCIDIPDPAWQLQKTILQCQIYLILHDTLIKPNRRYMQKKPNLGFCICIYIYEYI